MLKRKILYIALGLLTQDYWASGQKLLSQTEVLQQTEGTQTESIFIEGDSREFNEIMQENTPSEQIFIDNYNKFCESMQKLPKLEKNKVNDFFSQYNTEQEKGKKKIKTDGDIKNNIAGNTIKASDSQYAALQGIITSLTDYATSPKTTEVENIIDTLNDLADIRTDPRVQDDIYFCIGVFFFKISTEKLQPNY